MATGEKIKIARKKAGLTQKALAQKTGLATGTIQQYEYGDYKPKIEQLRRIAAVLGVCIGDLVDDWENYSKEEIEATRGIPCVIAHEDVFKADGYPLNQSEKLLLDNYRKLNPTGQTKAVEQVEMLTKIPEYQKEPKG